MPSLFSANSTSRSVISRLLAEFQVGSRDFRRNRFRTIMKHRAEIDNFVDSIAGLYHVVITQFIKNTDLDRVPTQVLKVLKRS